MDPWAATLVVGAVMAVGVSVAAVIDELVLRGVSGASLRPGSALAAPFRRASLLLVQERSVTERPDAPAWALAPALLAGLAAVAVAAVPLAPQVAVADVSAGIVMFGAAMALVMVAVYLEGWAANSPFALIGGYRFIAQALSYEMPIALVLIAVALPARSLGIGEIVESQAHLWNVVRQPLGLPIYLVAALGLAFWGPLALPEGRDLASGVSAELSGHARLLWRVAQLSVLVAVAAMGAAAFLGGWQGPLLPGWAWGFLKTLALLALLVASRHLLPRVRPERFVVVSWVVLIPLAFIDIAGAGIQALWAGR